MGAPAAGADRCMADRGNSSKEGFASAAVAVVRHARIDVGHANPVANWTAMGRPTYPTPEEIAKLETASEQVAAMASGSFQAAQQAMEKRVKLIDKVANAKLKDAERRAALEVERVRKEGGRGGGGGRRTLIL